MSSHLDAHRGIAHHSSGEHGTFDEHGAVPFTASEIAQFHREDLAAGRAVVCLMVGIFCIGVVLYTIVAVACVT